MRVEVVVHRPTGSSNAMPLVGQVSIGRGPENDIVIPNLRVSWNHALVFEGDNGAVMVKDLGSSNGTLLDGKRVLAAVAWDLGSKLQVGDVELTLGNTTIDMPLPARALAVEDVATGVRYPLRRPHVRIGDSPDADLRIKGDKHMVVTLITHADGEIWLGVDDEDRLLEPGEVFAVSDVKLRVVEADTDFMPTITDDDSSHPYCVEACFDPSPSARVTDERSGVTHTLTAWNRVSLLYFLAAARVEDDDRPSIDRGWRSNQSVQVAVWGRSGRDQDPGKLKALLHTVRSELRGAGLDPWCLEKRRGFLRLRVRNARLQQ